jgi:hypothetical protein
MSRVLHDRKSFVRIALHQLDYIAHQKTRNGAKQQRALGQGGVTCPLPTYQSIRVVDPLSCSERSHLSDSMCLRSQAQSGPHGADECSPRIDRSTASEILHWP